MSLNPVASQSKTDVLGPAAWHSLAWLLIANCVGLLLAILLLFPGVNGSLGEWTYGRWMPVHLNLQLYGWCSLPLVAWLLKVYHVENSPAARWSRSALWAWSAALAFGAFSWLTGHTGGKIFLDWQGYARVLFPLATFVLWLVLAGALRSQCSSDQSISRAERLAKIFGLVVLLSVPATLYWAADPKIYPPVNPDTGGPTGASLLESTLGIVSVLLLLPYGCGRKLRGGKEFLFAAWGLFVFEIALSLSLGRDNASHRLPLQFLGLGSLLPWIVLLPLYFKSFNWPANSGLWLNALLFWWGVLLASAWTIFLPGLLDRFKFTDGLVGHSHLAMAGFVSSMNIFLLVNLLGEKRQVFDSRWAFFAWHGGALGYIVAMFFAGSIEGRNPAFSFVPGELRDWVYLFRLVCGALMTAAALHWFRRATQINQPVVPVENLK